MKSNSAWMIGILPLEKDEGSSKHQGKAETLFSYKAGNTLNIFLSWIAKMCDIFHRI